VVIAKQANGSWSAPCAIGTGGLGMGMQLGGQLTLFILLLNTDEAVAAFAKQGNVALGAELGVAAGPLGRALSAEVRVDGEDVAPVFSYSHSRGLFAGVSIEGSAVYTRDDANAAFYGRSVTAKELLTGIIDPPAQALPLYDALQPVNMTIAEEDRPEWMEAFGLLDEQSKDEDNTKLQGGPIANAVSSAVKKYEVDL